MGTGLASNIDAGTAVGVHLGFEGVHLLCDPYLSLAVDLLLDVLQLLCRDDNRFVEGIVGCGADEDVARKIPLASRDDYFITGTF